MYQIPAHYVPDYATLLLTLCFTPFAYWPTTISPDSAVEFLLGANSSVQCRHWKTRLGLYHSLESFTVFLVLITIDLRASRTTWTKQSVPLFDHVLENSPLSLPTARSPCWKSCNNIANNNNNGNNIANKDKNGKKNDNDTISSSRGRLRRNFSLSTFHSRQPALGLAWLPMTFLKSIQHHFPPQIFSPRNLWADMFRRKKASAWKQNQRQFLYELRNR